MKTWNTLKGALLFFILVFSMLLLCACSESEEGASGEATNNNGIDQGSNETYQIRLAHVVAEDHPFHLAALEFKEEIEDKSEGRIEIELFPNGQLYGSEREAVEAVQLGNIEMSRVATPVIAGFIPEFSIFNLPFLFDTKEDAHDALDGELGQALTDLLPDIDVVAFGFGENGFRHILNNKKPIEKPEDISGLTLRVIENKMYEDLFNSLGANASPLGFGETYTALQQGVFDGLDSEIAAASTAKFDEVLDYLTLSSHTYTPTITIIGEQYFESLPEDLQEILAESTYNLNKRHREINMEYEEEGLRELEKAMEVNELTEEQREAFKEELQPVFDKYTEIVGEDLIELAENVIE